MNDTEHPPTPENTGPEPTAADVPRLCLERRDQIAQRLLGQQEQVRNTVAAAVVDLLPNIKMARRAHRTWREIAESFKAEGVNATPDAVRMAYTRKSAAKLVLRPTPPSGLTPTTPTTPTAPMHPPLTRNASFSPPRDPQHGNPTSGTPSIARRSK